MTAFSFHQLFESADIYLNTSDSMWFTDTSRILYPTTDIDTITSRLINVSSIALSHDGYTIWIQKLIYLANFISPRSFIFAGTDIAYTQDDIQELLEAYPKSFCFLTNFIGNHPRCILIPLGNHTFVTGLPQKTKENIVCIPYCRPNSYDRIEFYDFINANPVLNSLCIPELPVADYHKVLSQCFFSICCSGNGYDTFRFWEVLCNQSIPIVKRNIFFERLKIQYPRLPFVCIDSWTDLFGLLQKLTPELYKELWDKSDTSCLWSPYWKAKFTEFSNTPLTDAHHAPHFSVNSAEGDCYSPHPQ